MKARHAHSLALTICLASCSGTGRPPALLSGALDSSDLAAEAFAQGRHSDAAEAYGAALDAHRSVDNPPGIIRNLLNLAIVSDASGNTGLTREYLDAIDRYTDNLAGSSPGDLGKKETRILLAEVTAFRARLALDNDQPDLAARELARISDIPRSVSGRISNLHARLAEKRGDFPAMLRHASAGISANRRAKDEPELADSQRLAARAYLATGRHTDAEKHFLEALELDRKLARPNCVKADLEGLAGTASMAGDPGKAALFRKRARATQLSAPVPPAP